MVARGAIRSIKVATASHFLFADCWFIAGVLVVGVKQGRGGFCSGWSWCNLASDKKFLFTTLDVYHLRFRLFPEPLLRSLKSGNSGGRGAILRLTENACSFRLMLAVCATAYFRNHGSSR